MGIFHLITRSGLRKRVPYRIRAFVRQTLSRINYFDAKPASIGLKTIYNNDIFIISYPRSGNTWIRFLIAYLLHPSETVTFKNIEQFIPDIYKSASTINSMPPPRYIKTHDPVFASFPHEIYVYRDGRDVSVSFYHYLIERGQFSGTFSEFIRKKWITPAGSWHNHVEQALAVKKKTPERILLLQYEQMLKAPIEHAAKIAEFCKISVTPHDIETAVERSSFSELQHIEKKHGPEFENSNVKFFRKGKSGQWESTFSPSDMEYFLKNAGETLQSLGYIK